MWQAILRETAKDLGPKGWDKSFGAGLMQALPAVIEAEKRKPKNKRNPKNKKKA